MATRRHFGLGMLDVSNLGRGGLGDMHGAAANYRSACCNGRQFRKGHPY